MRAAMRGAEQQAAAPRVEGRRVLARSSVGCHIAASRPHVSPCDHDPLAPLFAPLTTLHGVGPTVAGLIARATGGERVIDLLFHLPERYLDRRDRPTIARGEAGRRW